MQVKVTQALPTANFLEKLKGTTPASLRQKIRFIVHPQLTEFAILTERTGVFFEFLVEHDEDGFSLHNPGYFVDFEKDEVTVDRAIKLIWDHVRDYLNIATDLRKIKPIVAYENIQSTPLAKTIDGLTDEELEVEMYKANLIRFKAMSQMGKILMTIEDANL